jgi:hypothetical protein
MHAHAGSGGQGRRLRRPEGVALTDARNHPACDTDVFSASLHASARGHATWSAPRGSLLATGVLAPALSEPPSKEPRPSAATMRRAPGAAGRPRAASRAPRTPVRGAQTARSKGLDGTLRQLRRIPDRHAGAPPALPDVTAIA